MIVFIYKMNSNFLISDAKSIVRYFPEPQRWPSGLIFFYSRFYPAPVLASHTLNA